MIRPAMACIRVFLIASVILMTRANSLYAVTEAVKVIKSDNIVTADKIYYNETSTDNYCETIEALSSTGGAAMTNSFGVSVPVKSGDVVFVEFYGSAEGHVFMTTICQSAPSAGTFTTIVNPNINMSSSASGVAAFYKPFCHTSIFRATGAGTLTFTQQFAVNTAFGSSGSVYLYGRAVYARIIKSATANGSGGASVSDLNLSI